jgi:hypothetical protein
MKLAAFCFAACLALGLSGASLAQDFKPMEKHTETALSFEVGSGYRNFTLTVTGPNGFHATAASKDSVPSIDLRAAGAHDDGVYTYQLTASADEKIAVRSELDNGRSAAANDSMLKSVSASGQVHLKDGKIQKFAATAEHEGEKFKRPPRERK